MVENRDSPVTLAHTQNCYFLERFENGHRLTSSEKMRKQQMVKFHWAGTFFFKWNSKIPKSKHTHNYKKLLYYKSNLMFWLGFT